MLFTIKHRHNKDLNVVCRISDILANEPYSIKLRAALLYLINTRQDVKSLDLIGADLSNLDCLQGLDFFGCDFTLANVSESDMQNCNLSFTKFLKTDLSKSNLRGSNLGAAIFFQSDLSYSNLSDTDTTGAVFNGSNLFGANIVNSGLDYEDTVNTKLDIVSVCVLHIRGLRNLM